MVDAIMGIVPTVYEFAKPYINVEWSHSELRKVVQELECRVEDMDKQARMEEAKPGKRRKRVLEAYIKLTEEYKTSARSLLERSHEGQWKIRRMRYVPSIERHHREGEGLLSKGRQLEEQGLTYNEIILRGVKLAVEEDQYIGETLGGHLESALNAMKDGSCQCIGIYGFAGAGKTNLLKLLYNKIYEDDSFKAVYWATAPDPDSNNNFSYNKALQSCVADGMCVDLDVVHDEVRCAGRIMARLREIGSGLVVYFLDNVRREFLAYELLGIPSQLTPNGNSILVFTTLSKEVCNRMKCDLTLEMGLLGENEARDLFLHQVGCFSRTSDNQLSNQDRIIRQVAVQVANQCARMPIAIIIIARSMANIDSLHEWRNRLNELMDTIAAIHDDETRILELLKIGFHFLKDSTVKQCFLAAANLLGNDRQVSKQEIIDRWKFIRLIGLDIQDEECANDQGHVILNQLQRLCLLQLGSRPETVTMNKWIWKLANKISRNHQLA